MKILETKNLRIAANVSGSEDSPKLAILMPGRLDTKDYTNFISHADYLSRRGFLVAAIDPTTTWDSPGELDNYTTSSYVQAINEIINYFGNRSTLLLGHSRGGATAMLSSANLAVCGLVLINAAYGSPTSPDPAKLEGGKLVEYRDLPPGKVRTAEQKRFDLPLSYFEDGSKHDPVTVLAAYKGPKLLVHAVGDEFVSVARVKEIFKRLSDPKILLEINGTHDYRLYPEEIEAVNTALGVFIDKYLSLNRL
jgi:pimeloyl-ACP methyl ester carboxylesterase